MVKERLLQENLSQADRIVAVNITKARDVTQCLMAQTGSVQLQDTETELCSSPPSGELAQVKVNTKSQQSVIAGDLFGLTVSVQKRSSG